MFSMHGIHALTCVRGKHQLLRCNARRHFEFAFLGNPQTDMCVVLLNQAAAL